MSENASPAVPVMSAEEFAQNFTGRTVAEIKQLVREGTGVEIAETAHAKVVDAAYKAYRAHLEAPARPPMADPAPAPASKPAKPRKADAPAPASVPAADVPLRYEARSRTGMPFRKLGLVFGPKWEPIGERTADELKVLDKYAAHLSYRIAR